MARRKCFKRALQYSFVLVPAVVLITIVLHKYRNQPPADSSPAASDMLAEFRLINVPSKPPAGSCVSRRNCPEDHFSFYIQSGAANVLAPKICVGNSLVLGTVKNNAGFGINIVVLNGRTGEVIKTDHFNMYSGDVTPLIELLKRIEKGSVVLMATYDDPSSKLTKDARALIAELGSSSINSLGFRDNWVFVGGKGVEAQSTLEKYLKNDKTKNKYDGWPELIELQGCIPKYLEAKAEDHVTISI